MDMTMTELLLEDSIALLQLLVALSAMNGGILVVIAFFIAKGNK